MARQRRYRKKERIKRGPKAKPKKYPTRQNQTLVQAMVKMREKLHDLFREKGWDKQEEQYVLRALTSSGSEVRKKRLIRLPEYMQVEVLEVMARDPDKNVKALARKLLKKLREE